MTPLILVMAKAPVAGLVKTRLCPPLRPAQAAAVAAAALADTLDAVSWTRAAARVLVLAGAYPAPPGWLLAPQRGAHFAARLANAFLDTAAPPRPSLLVGMDTPQLSPELLDDTLARLSGADAVVAPAEDGGWWALGLRDPAHATVLRAVTMSTSDTGRDTVTALRRRGLVVATGATLRDVDTAADARAVAQRCPDGRFARAVQTHLPAADGAGSVEVPA
jgi:glycosyltransferase A (GT-A) superfamily protein (DUF2064 family)